jgi:hypothetical protein
MIATLLVALFATIALASAVTLADAAVRGRNAFRLLRGDLARIDTLRRVTVEFADMEAAQRMPALRAVPVKAGRSATRPARGRTPERLRAAA